METKLIAGSPRRQTLVETRSSGRKPLERALLRVIEIFDKYDPIATAEPYEWRFEQRGTNGWFELERYAVKAEAHRSARRYEADGAEVQWWRKSE
jgi:hypothetical protein